MKYWPLLVLAACGRTEPVDGRNESISAVAPPAPSVPDASVTFIEAGACVGTAEECPRGFHCESGGAALTVPFVVTVRNRGTLTTRTGIFRAGESDSGAEGSGVTVLEFDLR